MADSYLAAETTDAGADLEHAAAAPRRQLLGTTKTRRRRSKPIVHGLAPAKQAFKCAFAERSGCTEGTDGSDRGYSGAYHAVGQPRAARTFDFNHWEQFCGKHWNTIMGNSESSGTAAGGGGSGSGSGSSRQPGVSADDGAAAGSAGGAVSTGTAVDGVTRGGSVGNAMPAGTMPGAAAARTIGRVVTAAAAVAAGGRSGTIAGDAGFPNPSGPAVQKERLSRFFFNGARCPTMNDPDAPRKLEPRVQRHEDLTPAYVRAAVKAVVLPLCKGMPIPQRDGSLSDPRKWEGLWKNPASWPGPYIHLEDPGVRAERCKESGGWTPESKELARQHHLVTGTVVLLMPEVYNRQALMQDEMFQVRQGGEVVGVRLPCPTCRSNAHTHWASWNEVRMIHTVTGENLLLRAPRYQCLNSACTAVKKGVQAAMKNRDRRGQTAAQKKSHGLDNVDKATPEVKAALRAGEVGNYAWAVNTLLNGGVSFTISEQSYMRMMPAAVQATYDFECFKKGGATHALLDLTVTGAQPVAALHRQSQEVYDRAQRQKHIRWNIFASVHKDAGRFPQLGVVGDGTLLSGPSAQYMKTYCEKAFEAVQPLLKRAICNTRPGKSISLDATFKLAKMATGSASCIVFVMGELGHIVCWAALRSDKWSNVLPLLYALKKRLTRLGTLEELTKVFADTCCSGRNNVFVHVCVNLFPMVLRAPFCDNFHKVQIISTATLSAHPLHAAFTKEVGQCIAKMHEPDIHRVAASIIETTGATAEDAMKRVLTPHYRRFIRTSTPPDIVERLEAVYEKYLKLSNECKERGERPLYLETKGASQGTESAFRNVIACAKKGCFSPSDVVEAYVCNRIGAVSGNAEVKKTEGTGGNEALHSKANGRIAPIASRIGEDRSQREISLFVHEYNRNVDENRGIARRDFLRHFWEEEKIRNLSSNVDGPSPGGNLTIPPELPDAEMELMGYEYLDVDQDKVAMDIANEHAIDLAAANAISLPTALEPGGNMSEEAQMPSAAMSELAEEPSFGRHGGRGRESFAQGGANAGRGGAPTGSGEAVPGGAAASAAPEPPAQAPQAGGVSASTSAGRTPNSTADASLALQSARAVWAPGAAVGVVPAVASAGAAAVGVVPAAGRTGAAAAGAVPPAPSAGGPGAGTGPRVPAGPREGQGRLPKIRKVAALCGAFSKPSTRDEEELAARSMGAVRARGVDGQRLWEECAAEYNTSLASELQVARDIGRPTSRNYKFRPISRDLFQEYWKSLSDATVLQRAGAPCPFPHFSGAGISGAESGA
ncbi:unnamed protein product, partial [Scytosiphon promiscuus]